jgi:hypothetical protein
VKQWSDNHGKNFVFLIGPKMPQLFDFHGGKKRTKMNDRHGASQYDFIGNCVLVSNFQRMNTFRVAGLLRIDRYLACSLLVVRKTERQAKRGRLSLPLLIFSIGTVRVIQKLRLWLPGS